MSTHTVNYVFYGVVLPYAVLPEDDEVRERIMDEYEDSSFRDETNRKHNCTAIIDGMSGEYVAVGHVYARSPSYEGFNVIVSIPSQTWDDDVLAALLDMGITNYPPFGWHIMTHYR